MALYIGLISGTSIDGIDAALVAIDQAQITVLGTHSESIPEPLRDAIHTLALSAAPTFDTLYEADIALGECFACATQHLLEQSNVDRGSVVGIGSHGQTIHHAPNAPRPYTVQIGDPNIIAERTGITTVADFRRRDMAAGGQGAPLAPAFHAAVFGGTDGARAVINIGGIANITFLPSLGRLGKAVSQNGNVSGFDTGPGNGLMDSWIRGHRGAEFDRRGNWARSGKLNLQLLERMLKDAYLQLAPPKSTGREYFNLPWVRDHLASFTPIRAADVQNTLCEFTARTITEALTRYCPSVEDVLVCGGGVHNELLMGRLQALLAPTPVHSTQTAGMDPDWVEAVAFAWLAERTIAGKPGNLPSVTGASRAVVLGAIYPSPSNS